MKTAWLNFTKLFVHVSVARSSSNGVAICYMLH